VLTISRSDTSSTRPFRRVFPDTLGTHFNRMRFTGPPGGLLGKALTPEVYNDVHPEDNVVVTVSDSSRTRRRTLAVWCRSVDSNSQGIYVLTKVSKRKMEEMQSSKGNIHTLLLAAGRSLVIAGASTLVLSSFNARPARKNIDTPPA
jgi:hypothetical protein